MVKRPALVTEVYVTLEGSRKQAERWVRSAIEWGEIDDAILPPGGVEIRDEKEHLIWILFTRASAKGGLAGYGRYFASKIREDGSGYS